MRDPCRATATKPSAGRRVLCALLLAAMALQPSVSSAQRPTTRSRRPPAVAVLALTSHADTARVDTTALAQGVVALLETELAASRRLRVVGARPNARTGRTASTGAEAVAAVQARGASLALLTAVTHDEDSVRVAARLARGSRRASVALDPIAVGRDDVLTLVDELAHAVADSLAPRSDATRGGPIFRPPRPPVPFSAMSAYSRAVAARAAGDVDTAARLLREVVSAAPRWDQPRRELAALGRRS